MVQRAEAPAAGPARKGPLLFAGLAAAGIAARYADAGLAHGYPATMHGVAAFVVAGALLTALGLPRQLVAFAGGYTFGAWFGVALALAAQMMGCGLDFWWARTVARDWARRHLGNRLARLDRWLASRPFVATLTLRLLPVGNNLALNLMAGVSGLRAAPFLAASLVGYAPQTAVFALTGSGVHVNRLVQLGLGGALFIVSAGLGWFLLRSGMANSVFGGAAVQAEGLRRS